MISHDFPECRGIHLNISLAAAGNGIVELLGASLKYAFVACHYKT